MSCLQLEPTNACGPAFAGFFISTASFPTLAAFDSQITDNQVNFYRNTLGCTGFSANSLTSLRYQLSYQCASVISSQNCTQNSPVPSLCSSECILQLSSLILILKDANTCPSTTPEFSQARQSFFTNHEMFCSSTESSTTCVRGVQLEETNCGFSNSSVAVSECKTAIDSCCVGFSPTIVTASAKSTTGSNITSTIVSKSEPTVSNESGTAKKLSSEPEAVSPAIIGVIVALALLFIIFISFLLIRSHNQKKKQKIEEDSDPFKTPMARSISAPVPSKTISTPLPSPPTSALPPTKTQPSSQFIPPPPTPTIRHDIAKKMIVIHQFKQSANDELNLTVGEIIITMEEFADGWGRGRDSNGRVGVFPLICVSPA